jgi:hypothetical protein
VRIYAATAPPEWVTIQLAGQPPRVLDPNLPGQAFTNSGTNLLFDFVDLGHRYTGLRLVARADTGAPTFTPEASYFPAGPAEVGAMAPQPFSLAAGQCYGDPYGIDEMRPYWRLWVAGVATGAWGVLGIPRA